MKNIHNSEDATILDLIQNQKIAHQQELVEKLKALGVHIPQSTLSRRLKSLGIAKIHNYYQIIDLKKPVGVSVLSLKVSFPNLIVLHTLPGHANSIAFQLDQKMDANKNSSLKKSYQFLLGTIAGDDTILLISDGTKEGIEKLKKEIEKDFMG